MSADIVMLPDLNDHAWVAWQAEQITAIARNHRPGGTRFREHERFLYRALQTGFDQTLDRWHSWEWIDSLGGVVTRDRCAPEYHPYLGVVRDVTFESVAEAHQDLLWQALAEAELILRRMA